MENNTSNGTSFEISSKSNNFLSVPWQETFITLLVFVIFCVGTFNARIRRRLIQWLLVLHGTRDREYTIANIEEHPV